MEITTGCKPWLFALIVVVGNLMVFHKAAVAVSITIHESAMMSVSIPRMDKAVVPFKTPLRVTRQKARERHDSLVCFIPPLPFPFIKWK